MKAVNIPYQRRKVQYHLKKQQNKKVVFANLKSFDKRFICLQCKQKKITDHEIINCDSCNVMTTINCSFN